MTFYLVKNKFHGNFRINDIEYNATKYNDSTTEEFQKLKNELQPELQQHMCGADEILSCEVKITRFSPGSIVCDFEIELQTTMDESTLETYLRSQLSSLNITTFDITPVTISTQGNKNYLWTLEKLY